MNPPENSFHPLSRAEWRAWLLEHHARPDGLWLINHLKASGKPRLDMEDIVEEAVCFGWIDSLPRKLDDERTMLWLAPRKPGSNWSAINKARVDRMMQAGLMHPSGIAKVEAAREDGSWSALDAVEALVVPPDLQAAFDARPGAEGHWLAFPRWSRRAMLEWLVNAKRAATRERRITEIADAAAVNQRANEWPKRKR
ncbi:MAG: YdeI/OmpD-associated family protein [Rhodothermales bacterium]|nr:YdeI/OmpD-associated family protein [Rhodothermales bacterium]MBO6778299.1 YdeI/OmpD-associated family protein [Rhodothermales bacterium]